VLCKTAALLLLPKHDWQALKLTCQRSPQGQQRSQRTLFLVERCLLILRHNCQCTLDNCNEDKQLSWDGMLEWKASAVLCCCSVQWGAPSLATAPDFTNPGPFGKQVLRSGGQRQPAQLLPPAVWE
jgi:hypothetical protein